MMSGRVFCPVPSLPSTVKGLLSCISVFKQDKVPVHIWDLSSPHSPNCHSAGVMKAFTFCLKVGDQSRTAVTDLAALTHPIRVADPGQESGSEEREGVCLTLLKEEVKEKVDATQGSVSVCR